MGTTLVDVSLAEMQQIDGGVSALDVLLIGTCILVVGGLAVLILL